MFGAVRLRAVGVASHGLFMHSERIRAAIQGVYILDLCHTTVSCWQYWNITDTWVSCSQNSTLCVYIVENHTLTDSVSLNNMNVAEPPPHKWLKLSLKENSEQRMQRRAVRRTAITNLSPMERWELLHPVGSVCSTPWSMRWTRGDWATVHHTSKLNRNVHYAIV